MKVFTTRRFERRLTKFIKSHPESSGKVRQTMEQLASDPLLVIWKFTVYLDRLQAVLLVPSATDVA